MEEKKKRGRPKGSKNKPKEKRNVKRDMPRLPRIVNSMSKEDVINNNIGLRDNRNDNEDSSSGVKDNVKSSKEVQQLLKLKKIEEEYVNEEEPSFFEEGGDPRFSDTQDIGIDEAWIRGVEAASEDNVEITKYSFEGAPTLEAFCDSERFVNAVMGPFGSGKSSACIINILMKSMQQTPDVRDGVKRSRWLIVRNTYVELRDTTIRTIFEWLPPSKFGKFLKQENRYIISAFEGCEIELLFRALDRPDQIGSLLSLELTGSWINEYREIPKEIFEGIQGRVGRYPAEKNGGCRWYGVIMDTNPPDEDNFYYSFFETEDKFDKSLHTSEQIDQFRVIFRQPSGLSEQAENIKWLPKGYYVNMSVGKDPEWVKVYVEGQYGFTRDGKPVYMSYSDGLHYTDKPLEPSKNAPVIVGIDFGLAGCAAAFTQVLPGGQVICFDELFAADMDAKNFCKQFLLPKLMEYSGYKFVFVGDPAGTHRAQTDKRSCFMEAAACGIKIIPAITNNLVPRIDAVKDWLTRMVGDEPGFKIGPKAKMIRRGFLGKYRFKRVNVGGMDVKYKDLPEKNEYSHPHDGLQYCGLHVKHFSHHHSADDFFSGTKKKVKKTDPRKRWRSRI